MSAYWVWLFGDGLWLSYTNYCTARLCPLAGWPLARKCDVTLFLPLLECSPLYCFAKSYRSLCSSGASMQTDPSLCSHSRPYLLKYLAFAPVHSCNRKTCHGVALHSIHYLIFWRKSQALDSCGRSCKTATALKHKKSTHFVYLTSDFPSLQT